MIQNSEFVLRQFVPGFAGTLLNTSPEEFEARVNVLVNVLADSDGIWADGYAPFCKHLFVRNFTDALHGVARITPENVHLLRSSYQARREGELPILVRSFPKDAVQPERAEWLDLILYSKEQMEHEGEMLRPGVRWAIVAVLSAAEPKEAPMTPATMLRNALGVAEGGSGAPLDRARYVDSVAYWSEWANVQS